MAYLKVVGHFMGVNNNVKTVLLGIRRITGSHTGESLARHLIKLIDDYRIKDNLGYFMLNNADNMDTIVKHLLMSINR